MNAITSIGKGGRRSPASAAETPIAASIVPSSPALFPLRMLRRAPENVRHTRVDEDVQSLADDIAAHGLLQSLIGYEADGLIQVVGGGRRFQALREIENSGAIDGDFLVPVLVRHVDEAVELSLAENLQQRTMSPVDEFLGFQKLMERGTNSPADLAKRFGFSERVVRQRLRLADLAPEILDALAQRDITLDAAMAYASSQDRHLQSDVFKAQSKRGWEPHRPHNIRHDLRTKGMDTGDRLYRFVGAEIYERDGGGYEDDLFNEAGTERILDKPFLLETAAVTMFDFQMLRVLEELKADPELAPTIAGYVRIPDFRLHSWGTQAKLKAPAGFVLVDRYEHDKVWKTIRNNGIEVHVVVGLTDAGEIKPWPRMVFVPEAQRGAVDRPPQHPGYQQLTPEQEAAARRERGIIRWSRRLAIGPFAGTPLEGRAYWPEHYDDPQRATKIDGVSGFLVGVTIFVTEQQAADQRKAAEKRYDDDLAEQAAAEEKRKADRAAVDARWDELVKGTPPAVVVIDGLAWVQAEDGSYAPIDEEEDGFVPNWKALLANFDAAEIGETFETRDAFDAAMLAVDQGEAR